MSSPSSEAASSEVIIAGAVRVDAADRSRFVNVMERIADEARLRPGCEIFALSKDLREEDRFHLMEVWSDRGTLDAHTGNPKLKGDFEELMSIPMRDVSLTLYSVSGRESRSPPAPAS